MLKRLLNLTSIRFLVLAVIVALVFYHRIQSNDVQQPSQSVTIPVQEAVYDDEPSQLAFYSEPKLSIKDEGAFDAHYPSGNLREYLDQAEVLKEPSIIEDQKPAVTEVPISVAVPSADSDNSRW